MTKSRYPAPGLRRARASRHLNRRPTRLQVENLEDRVMLTAQVIEDFSGGNLAAYYTEYRYAPSATIVPGAAHDGVSNALVKSDGFEWVVRSDDLEVHQGETLSVWTQFAGAVDGRIYFGFGAAHEGLVRSPLSDGHTLALVLAGNTNQLMFMANDSVTSGFKHAPRTLGTAVAQTYNPDQWYRMEVVWGTDGSLVGNLYDSDGVTLLNSVTASETQITSGGIAFRGFGSDKYFDTVTADPGNGGLAQYRSRTVNHPHQPQQGSPPPGSAIAFPPLDITSTPAPFDYASVPGTNRDVALFSFNQLAQFGTTFFQINGQTRVGLAAQNVSMVMPNSNQILWGPNTYTGSGDVIPETPYLAQYLFRQRPGEPTYLIGSSDVKHFFSSAKTDYQHLNPGEQDTYGTSLNMDQTDFLSSTDLNPVTGEIHRFNFFGPRGTETLDPNGFDTTNGTRSYLSRAEHLLQVNVADLDPAQNPPGTRWFLAGNLWVAGDQDTSNNSRWVEVTPTLTGTTFSFTYPNGSGGQYNFRTIPGLQDAPRVIGAVPATSVGELSAVRVAFDESINPDTFTPDQVSLASSKSKTAAVAITPVDGSQGREFDIIFPAQYQLGQYTLTIGPDIENLDGAPMAGAFTVDFSLQGPAVVASTPANAAKLPGPLGSVRLTFNEPMDPATFTPAQVDLFFGPRGRIPVTAVTPVDGSNNTQFDVAFDTQGTTGYYTMWVGPDIYDLYGHQLDQNGNFIDGEIPGDLFTFQFGIQGPRITSATNLGSFDAGVYRLRVTFNEPMDPATFTPDKITGFSGPNGEIQATGVAPVADSDDTMFDIFFNPQTTAGAYRLTIGPDVRDRFGNQMDQNNNLITGEIPGDQFAATFTVLGPRITASSPSGSVTVPVDHVRVTFNVPIAVSSFTPDKVTRFTGPGGAIPVTDVVEVPNSGGTQFDITFDTQSTFGSYSMTIGPNIQDIYGNSMAAAYSATFQIQAPFYNNFGAYPYEDLEIYQNGGVPVRFTSGSYYADDDYGSLNLGGDTFTFAGVVYTSLFISSNGLVTFGGGVSTPTNTNLTSSPTQAAIAPLWSDWIKTATDPGGEMVLAKFEDTADGGRRLIIEWNKVRHYNGDNSLVTFQLILALDTGSAPGDIIFNYVQIDTTDGNTDGMTATVGIKDAGNQPLQGGRRLLVSQNMANDLLGSQQAILITLVEGGAGRGHTLGRVVTPVSPDVVRSGSLSTPVQPVDVTTGALALVPDVNRSVLDQVFAATSEHSPLSGGTALRRLGRGPVAAWSDPFTDDLGGQL